MTTTPTSYRVERFNPDTATEEAFRAVNGFANRIRAEEFPDDPPRSLASTIRIMRGWKVLESIDIQLWAVWQEREVVAELLTVVAHYDDNKHLMNLQLKVVPEHRRLGLGSGLLGKALETAERNHRTLLMSYSYDAAPAGSRFAERVGAERGIETHTNRLVLSEIDRELLRDWQERANTTASDFVLGFWAGPYPEEEIQAVAEIHNVMNTAPKDRLEVEDWQITPGQLRQSEAYMEARGVERWTLYARHKPSGNLAGYTEVVWDPENPEALSQEDTAVVPEYRGHGLGKWLKAAMIARILEARPEVKRIYTVNADSNAPMSAINRALGFRPYQSETVWQVKVERLKAYLESRG